MKKYHLLVLLLIVMMLSACGTNENTEKTREELVEYQIEETETKTDSQVEIASVQSEQSESGPEIEEPEFESKIEEPKSEPESPVSELTTQEPENQLPTGPNIQSRILAPDGFTRVAAESGSLQEFLRAYPLKEEGSPVLLYDGSKKRSQNAHVVVFDLPIENYDLQQCADSIMRMYAEYFLATGQAEKIQFHFTNGFLADYKTYRDGNRIAVDGNNVSWTPSTEYDDSYETFVKYMKIVFNYAGTLSMENESTPIEVSDVRAGDVILKGGSPGHVIMIVDVCENEAGEKAFLLAQGYMPAQEFHVLKNPLHEDDPWYYETEISYPLQTPEYVFPEGSFKRLCYENN